MSGRVRDGALCSIGHNKNLKGENTDGKIYLVCIYDSRQRRKVYSFCQRIRNNQNLVDYAKQAYTMNACDSKKEAEKIAAAWNETYKKNATANKWIA